MNEKRHTSTPSDGYDESMSTHSGQRRDVEEEYARFLKEVENDSVSGPDTTGTKESLNDSYVSIATANRSPLVSGVEDDDVTLHVPSLVADNIVKSNAKENRNDPTALVSTASSIGSKAILSTPMSPDEDDELYELYELVGELEFPTDDVSESNATRRSDDLRQRHSGMSGAPPIVNSDTGTDRCGTCDKGIPN